MGIREKVKKGQLSSEDALALAQKFEDDAPDLKGWLKRRIDRGADAEEEAAREKAAEKVAAEKKAEEDRKRKANKRPRRRRQK
jgi:hypothetical protein